MTTEETKMPEQVERGSRTYRIVETVRYEVVARDEKQAEALFAAHRRNRTERPVRYVGVDDIEVVEIINDRGKRTVVAPR